MSSDSSPSTPTPAVGGKSYPTYSWAAITRTKNVEAILRTAELDSHSKNALKKCLSRFDVVAYGIGSTIGAGLFVTTGNAAALAGPAVILCFLVSTLACLFSAFAYAEFSARVPISGSAYTFTYVCLGELTAWFVGWNLVLEYSISAAAVARGWGSNVSYFFKSIGASLPDALWNADVGNGFNLSILAVIICVLCMLVLLLGVKESATVNKITTVVNISLILFIIILGSFHVDRANWNPTDQTLADYVINHPDDPDSSCATSSAGFAPMGLNGVLSGAAQTFFAYIGFDAVTTLAEEVADPKRDIPFGVISTLGITTVLYVGASMIVTGMKPWCALDPNAPIADVFSYVGLNWASSLIAAVTVSTLSVNVLCSIFGQPRIFFRMAKDGLLFRQFAYVHPKTQAPVVGIVVTGGLAAIIAFLFDITILGNMISIGTLMAFSTVCFGVIVLRYKYDRFPSLPVIMCIVYILPTIGLAVSLRNLSTVNIAVPIIMAVLMLIPAFVLFFLPQGPPPVSYICPFVPFLPLLGVFCNIYLITSLDVASYIRVGVWTGAGLAIYFAYGILQSEQGKSDREGTAYQPLVLNDEVDVQDATPVLLEGFQST